MDYGQLFNRFFERFKGGDDENSIIAAAKWDDDNKCASILLGDRSYMTMVVEERSEPFVYVNVHHYYGVISASDPNEHFRALTFMLQGNYKRTAFRHYSIKVMGDGIPIVVMVGQYPLTVNLPIDQVRTDDLLSDLTHNIF